MIALDTSALLRYITDDVPGLAAQVERLIDGDEPVGLSALVLLECLHALLGLPYASTNPALADGLVALLAHENVVLTDLDGDLASAAILGVRDLSARHIAHALIGAAARQAGARELVTNDAGFRSDLVAVTQLTG